MIYDFMSVKNYIDRIQNKTIILESPPFRIA